MEAKTRTCWYYRGLPLLPRYPAVPHIHGLDLKIPVISQRGLDPYSIAYVQRSASADEPDRPIGTKRRLIRDLAMFDIEASVR